MADDAADGKKRDEELERRLRSQQEALDAAARKTQDTIDRLNKETDALRRKLKDPSRP